MEINQISNLLITSALLTEFIEINFRIKINFQGVERSDKIDRYIQDKTDFYFNKKFWRSPEFKTYHTGHNIHIIRRLR